MTASVDIPMFIVSRFIMEFGIGILVTLVPLYQSEVLPAKSRGLMVGLHGVLIGFSHALAGVVTYGYYFANYGLFQWQFSLSVQLIPTITLLIGSFFIAYSPRWLWSQGREEEACSTTRKLHKHKSDPQDDYARAEVQQMRDQIAFERRDCKHDD